MLSRMLLPLIALIPAMTGSTKPEESSLTVTGSSFANNDMTE
jgi:hypothetical protein